MWTWAFWEQTLERIIRTFLAVVIAGGVGAQGFDAFTADWKTIISAALSASLVTLIFCVLASIPGDSSDPSFIGPIPEKDAGD